MSWVKSKSFWNVWRSIWHQPVANRSPPLPSSLLLLLFYLPHHHLLLLPPIPDDMISLFLRTRRNIDCWVNWGGAGFARRQMTYLQMLVQALAWLEWMGWGQCLLCPPPLPTSIKITVKVTGCPLMFWNGPFAQVMWMNLKCHSPVNCPNQEALALLL